MSAKSNITEQIIKHCCEILYMIFQNFLEKMWRIYIDNVSCDIKYLFID